MNTRTEIINGYTYCAYCGKELGNPHYAICPNPPMICDCETAKEELALYKKLKELYNAPLAESLIEKKVKIYRNKLLGIKESMYCPADYLVSVTCADTLSSKINVPELSIESVANSTAIGVDMLD